jgi:hypothetical protein
MKQDLTLTIVPIVTQRLLRNSRNFTKFEACTNVNTMEYNNLVIVKFHKARIETTHVINAYSLGISK